MRVLSLMFLALLLGACDIEEGPPIYNNPPPDLQSDLPSGQSHVDCPSGFTFC